MAALSHRRVKLLAVVSVWLAIPVVYLFALLPPASGYEISLYSSLPAPVWILTLGVLFLAQGGLLLMAFGTEDVARSRIWIGFLAATVLVELALLLLPYFQGYPVYGRGDVLTHVGFIRSIDAFGSVSPPDVYPNDIYPNLHLLVLTLWYATGIDPLHVINAVPPVVTLVSVVSLWFLLDEVLDDRRKTLAGMAFAALPIGTTAHVNPSPFAQSMLLVPLVLYLFVRARRTSDVSMRAAMSVALVSLVLYHPLTTLFVLVVFVTYGVVRQFDLFTEPLSGPSLAGYITMSAFATWYLQFATIVFKFRDIYEMFVATGEGGPSTLAQYSSSVSEASPALIDVLRIALFKYGVSMILVGLTFLYLLVALYLKRKGRLGLNRYGATLVAGALGFSVVSAAFFVQNFTVNYGRPLIFARYLALIPTGLVLYHLGNSLQGTRFGSSIRGSSTTGTLARRGLYVVLALFVVLTVSTVYYSPLDSRENHQVTQMELEGSQWVFEHADREEGIRVASFGWGDERHHEARYGIWNESAPELRNAKAVPEHFNYTERPYLGDSYDRDTSMGISKLARIVFEEKFPDYEELWSFTPEDFARLERDPTVNRVYDNGEFDGYRISATGPETAPE